MKFSHWCAGFLAIVAGVLGTANLFFASPGEGWPLFHEYHGLNSLFGESERKVELDQQLAETLARNSAKEKFASRIEAGASSSSA